MPNTQYNAKNTAIVLCTYNGEQHLQAQIASLLSQSCAATIFAFDDGSSDNTLAILKAHESEQFRIHQNGANLGYVKNFEAGIACVVAEQFQYIALADQDDIWNPDRLENGISAIEQLPEPEIPLLVHSDLSVIDGRAELIAPSYFKMRGYRVSKQRKLELILGQNGVMGNTILMNHSLAKLALPFPEDLHVHDYWLAVLSEIYGRRLLLDEPGVQYRLHEDNASNKIKKLKKSKTNPFQLSTWKQLLSRDFRLPFKEDSRDQVIAYLLDNSTLPDLTEDDRGILQHFLRYLRLDGSRLSLSRYMVASQYVKPGLGYRFRFVLAMLLSNRYR
jgi:glycosyltransferase involved in cell wall biosynthesis